MISADKLSHADQIATAVESIVSTGDSAGSRAIDLRVWDGIDVRLLPDRGLDIGAAWFRGTPLAWISENGEQGAVAADGLVDNLAWGAAWGGGLDDDLRALERRRRRRRESACTGRTRLAVPTTSSSSDRLRSSP